MNKTVVAKELIVIAKNLVAVEFPTQGALDKYLKEHPDADRNKHKVVKAPGGRKTVWESLSPEQRRRWESLDREDAAKMSCDDLMSRAAVAGELVAVAKALVGMDFPSQDALDKYLKDHPDADRSKHKVVQHDPSKSETHPYNLMRQRQNEEKMKEIGKHYKKDPKDLTVDEITEFNQRKGSVVTAAVGVGGRTTIIRQFTTKGGASFTDGQSVRLVEYTKEYPYRAVFVADTGEQVKMPLSAAYKYVRGFAKPPSIGTLQKWSDDGVARAVDGARVEPDGFSPAGAPSWLLVVGVI